MQRNNVFIVLGFHKSGTTLVSKTLHESGVDMGVACSGDYNSCKYEDKMVQQIKKDILYGGQGRKSYQLPWTYNDYSTDIKQYIKMRENEGGDWGFKVPDITLCYDMWKPHLPEHTLIGIKRSTAGVLNHYARKQKNRPDPGVVKFAKRVYDAFIDLYIPEDNIVWFEDLLREGPSLLERITGLKNLKDVRVKK